MAAATAEAAAAATAAELRALQESCLRGSFIRPGRAAIVRRRARAVGKAGSQCSQCRRHLNSKLVSEEIDMSVLTAGDASGVGGDEELTVALSIN